MDKARIVELYAEVATEKLRPVMLEPVRMALAAGRDVGLSTEKIKAALIETVCGPTAKLRIALFARELDIPIASARILNRIVVTKLLDELLG